jgi:hypothetical protein
MSLRACPCTNHKHTVSSKLTQKPCLCNETAFAPPLHKAPLRNFDYALTRRCWPYPRPLSLRKEGTSRALASRKRAERFRPSSAFIQWCFDGFASRVRGMASTGKRRRPHTALAASLAAGAPRMLRRRMGGPEALRVLEVSRVVVFDTPVLVDGHEVRELRHHLVPSAHGSAIVGGRRDVPASPSRARARHAAT